MTKSMYIRGFDLHRTFVSGHADAITKFDLKYIRLIPVKCLIKCILCELSTTVTLLWHQLMELKRAAAKQISQLSLPIKIQRWIIIMINVLHRETFFCKKLYVLRLSFSDYTRFIHLAFTVNRLINYCYI